MKSRNSIFFSGILLLTTLSHVHAMQPKKMIKAAKKKVSGWVDTVGQALTGEIPTQVAIVQLNNAPNNKDSLHTTSSDTTSYDTSPFPFYKLLPEIRRQIIFFMTQFGISNNLTTAGKAINNLAQVNKELNLLINTPEYYFEISRSLAKRFDVSNEEVAKALQTEQAKKELFTQKNLFDLCLNGKKFTEIANASFFLQLINQGADLNFVYENGDTPLMVAIYTNPTIAIALVETDADPTITNGENKTPLMAAKEMGNDQLIKAIEDKLQSK